MAAQPRLLIYHIAFLCYLSRLCNIYLVFIYWLLEPIGGSLFVIQVRMIFGMKELLEMQQK